MKNTVIIIPTYNEIDNIEKLIIEIKKKVSDSEVFIIDDSKEKDIEKLVNEKNINVKYFYRGKKLGRGSAVIFGLKKALEENKYNIFLEMDADFSHDPNELTRNLEIFVKENLDLLISSRYLENSKIINWSLSRRILSKLSNFLARHLLNISIKDFTNGYRIYSARSVKKIISTCGNIGDGFIVLSEIIIVLSNNNFKISEIDTVFINRERGASSVNLRLVLASLFGLFKLFFIKNRLK